VVVKWCRWAVVVGCTDWLWVLLGGSGGGDGGGGGVMRLLLELCPLSW